MSKRAANGKFKFAVFSKILRFVSKNYWVFLTKKVSHANVLCHFHHHSERSSSDHSAIPLSLTNWQLKTSPLKLDQHISRKQRSFQCVAICNMYYRWSWRKWHRPPRWRRTLEAVCEDNGGGVVHLPHTFNQDWFYFDCTDQQYHWSNHHSEVTWGHW